VGLEKQERKVTVEKHIQMASLVASDDVEYLTKKDKTHYEAWKKGGGRGAWFAVLKKIHQLEQVMQLPNDPLSLQDAVIADDIFAKIEQHPDGGKGTALDLVRSIRRYLLLIEAEMVARNVAGTPSLERRRGDQFFKSSKIELNNIALDNEPKPLSTIHHPPKAWEETDNLDDRE
jgi:hypothetical protein